MKRTTLYYWWLIVFGLASIAIARDPWFHFRSVSELFTLSRLSSEFCVIIALFLIAVMAREDTHGRAFYTIIAGFIIFLLGAVADPIYHSGAGVAPTAWSPPHVIAFLGILLVVLGVMRQLIKDTSYGVMPTRLCDGLLLAFSIALFGFLWLPLLQQEQLSVTMNWGALPHWLYALSAGLVMGFTFKLIHTLVPRYGSVMSVAGGYLLFRMAADFIVPAGTYSVSMIPYFLMLSAVIFECVHPFLLTQTKGVLGIYTTAFLLVLPLTSVALIHTYPPIHPAISLASLVWALGSAAVGIALARPFQLIFFPDARTTHP